MFARGRIVSSTTNTSSVSSSGSTGEAFDGAESAFVKIFFFPFDLPLSFGLSIPYFLDRSFNMKKMTKTFKGSDKMIKVKIGGKERMSMKVFI